MIERYSFDTREEFLEKLEELVRSGTPKQRINTFTPYPVERAEELLDASPSAVRFWTGAGALAGCGAGFAFTIYTVLSWPIITGGKAIVSIPAFVIIAYELTILFGGVIAFAGFLFLTRMPSVRNVVTDSEEFSPKFEITVDHGGRA